MQLNKNLCTVRPIEAEDKMTLYSWRNSDRVRFSMLHQDIIPKIVHEAWFAKALNQENGIYLIFEISGIPTGLVGFQKINIEQHSAEWTFYIGSSSAPKGSGTLMCQLAIDFYFETLKMHTLYGQALLKNIASQVIHKKLNFEMYERTAEITYFLLEKKNWIHQQSN